MLTVLGCLTNAHDLWLVGLAASICALSAITTVQLLRHARKSESWKVRALWTSIGALSGGSGIWATHFIAMLAFEPGLPSGYNLPLTALSLVYAVALTGVGLSLALARWLPGAAPIGGVAIGAGIAAMHYTGMAAYEVGGHVSWDPVLVTASLILGATSARQRLRSHSVTTSRELSSSPRLSSSSRSAATISPRWVRPPSCPIRRYRFLRQRFLHVGWRPSWLLEASPFSFSRVRRLHWTFATVVRLQESRIACAASRMRPWRVSWSAWETQSSAPMRALRSWSAFRLRS
ncbi:hypothetical protein JNW90_23570 [Micromonospora sp. STR1s_5]|nr:hypothetical protein [Micromonospora sp. STR1s_5]